MLDLIDTVPPLVATAPAPRDRPLRILMVAARCLPFMGGIEMHIHEVSRRMVARGHSVMVLTTDPKGDLPPTETVDGVLVQRVKAWPANQDFYLAPTLWTEIMRGGWDVIHVQGYHTLVPPLAMAAALWRRLPFVLTFHSGGHSSPMRNMIRASQQRALAPLARNAAQLIGVSEHEAEHFSAAMGIPLDRFVVVPNGAELPTPSADAERARDPNSPLVLTIGRLERYKGHHRVIEAFPKILERMPGAKLRVLGAGPYKTELVALAARLGIGAAVEIGGIAAGQRQAMADVIVKAAVVALISEYEAHPVAVLEALALGRPVVATDSSGFKEMARKGMLSAVSLDADAQTIADAIVHTIECPPDTAAVTLPDWDDCTAQLLGIYRNVVDRQATVSPRAKAG